MRLASMLCLVSALVILAGCCGGGGCGVAQAPAAAPATYGSASGPSYERAPARVVREVARPAPSYERRLSRFTPPAAPTIPVARKAVRAPAPKPCLPVIRPPCLPKPCDPCPGGVCGIPDPCDPCAGGSCGIPSLSDLLDPCK